MGHGHDHGLHDHGARNRRALGASLALTVAFGAAQVVAGFVFDSLALLADAVHNVSDGLAIGLALGAAWLAGLPARGARTFGWRRLEILAALVNGITLVLLAIWILWESVVRLDDPGEVGGVGVIVVGMLGVVMNGVPVWLLLRRADHRDLNVRGALLHAAGDVLGSLGAVVAGVIVAVTGADIADPIVAALIGLVIFATSFGLLRDATRVLLEMAPPDLDPARVGERLVGVPGVRNVHDLHLWTVTSGLVSLSAHVVLAPGADADRVLHELERVSRDEFELEHTTFQLDRDHSVAVVQIHRAGCEHNPAVTGKRGS
jgi:cobalt-zinc-cadmium efflux system protein